MYTRHHLALSLLTVLPFLGWYDGPWGWPVLVVWGGAVGTLIDLDHFVLARIRTGNWRALRRCLRDPRVALLDQGEIFDPGEVGAVRRLASHLAIAGPACVALGAVSVSLGVVTAAVLYVHVLADAVWDTVQTRSAGG